MGGVVRNGIRGVGVVWVGEVSGSRADGENRRFLDTADFSLLGEVEVRGGESIENVLGQGRSDGMTESEGCMAAERLLKGGWCGLGASLRSVDEV